jgi:hypothetical protein
MKKWLLRIAVAGVLLGVGAFIGLILLYGWAIGQVH